MSAYIPSRDPRFHHASDAIAEIERSNCARGCIHAVDPGPDMPGGACDLLAAVAIGDGEPIPDLEDRGEGIHCKRREVRP